MIILYDKSMTTVIHPGTWSQHPFVLGVCFFLGRAPTDLRKIPRDY